jgi:hypothetical protein
MERFVRPKASVHVYISQLRTDTDCAIAVFHSDLLGMRDAR